MQSTKTSMQKRFSTWINKQPSSVRAAIYGGIIAGIFGICGASVAGCFALIQASITINSNISPTNPVVTTGTPSFSSIPFKIDIVSQLASGQRITTEIGNESIYLIPTKCWQFTNEYVPISSVENLEPLNAGQLYMQILIMSYEPIVIKKTDITLDDFQTPPSLSIIKQAIVSSPHGGGEVPDFNLENATLNSKFSQKNILQGHAYQLQANDTVIFDTLITFSEAGIYEFHFEFEAETFTGNSVVISSDLIKYGWLFVDKLDALQLFFDSQDYPISQITPCK